MVKQFGYKNPWKCRKLDKVVLNMGVGESTADSKKVTSLPPISR
jgi:large subunit ribosomal protein L5